MNISTDLTEEEFTEEYREIKSLGLQGPTSLNYITMLGVLSTNRKKELKRLHHLMRSNYVHYLTDYQTMKSNYDFVKQEIKDIYDLGLTYYGDSFIDIWKTLNSSHRATKLNYNKMPKAILRDNKDGLRLSPSVGSSGSSIRYPSLKRNKYTWKKFYALFPWAEKRKEV